MLQKSFFILLSLTFLFVFSEKTADAAELISVNEIDNLVNKNKGLYYDAVNDVMKLDYYGTRLVQGDIQFYHDAALTVKGSFKEFHANTNGWLMAVQFSCTGWYKSNVYTSDGAVAVSVVVAITDGDLKVDRCDSIYEEPTDDVIQEALCNSKICECIADLKASTDQVKQSVDSVKQSVDSVKESVDKSNNQLEKLNETSTEIKEVLKDFSEEFKTSIDYTVPANPDVSDLLEKNKPVQNEVPFKDDNIYFKDEGDASDPGKLPVAPDVKHWEGFLPESAIPAEKELKKDNEIKLDDELKKEKESKLDDELKKEKELDVEEIKSEPELKPDVLESEPVPETDEFKADAEFKKTNEFEQTNNFSKGGK